jgi:UDP-3-O-[3-hydroxymyristoyl] glucosamine N-acyltransferase
VNISKISQHNPRLEVRFGQFEIFASVGPLTFTDELLLTYARDERFMAMALSKPNIAVLFARPDDLPGESLDTTLVLSQDPQADFFRFHNYLAAETGFYGTARASEISPCADVHPSAFIEEQDVSIGAGARVGPKAVLLKGTTLEAGAHVGPGAVLGMDGAQLVNPLDGDRFSVTHVGGVLLCEGAYVGPNSVVARGLWPRPTTIGRNAYVGNLVNIGHNCIVGDEALVLPGAILCGSALVGDKAVISPGAIVAEERQIGPGSHVLLGAVVTRDVEAGHRVSGNFAIEHSKMVEHVKRLSRE